MHPQTAAVSQNAFLDLQQSQVVNLVLLVSNELRDHTNSNGLPLLNCQYQITRG